jgi:DNA-3-methyladenine glycosylase
MTESNGTAGFRNPDPGFFTLGVLGLAHNLLGCLLVHETPEGTISGLITETEAYHQREPSCHAFGGPTPGNWPMFERGGLAYIYRIYGIHSCFNISAGEEGTGEAVLVRALKPDNGLSLMIRNRGRTDLYTLCRGPGNLCRALGIDTTMNGVDLRTGYLRLLVPTVKRIPYYERTGRVGVTKAQELDWRFVLRPMEHE